MALAQRTSASARPESRSQVLYDESSDQRLAEVFAPCFAMIVHLRAHDKLGDPVALRQRIKDVLERASRDAHQKSIDPDHIDAAEFAVIAFLDETILSSTWDRKSEWASRPLQMEQYDRYDAGEVFFERLESMLSAPAGQAEAIEVYYLCMTLGFRGRYQIVEQEKLQEYIERCHDFLGDTQGVYSEVLSPHGQPRSQVTAKVGRRVPRWMMAVAALAIALLIYAGLSFYISQSAEEKAGDIQQMVEQARR
jgi:type VI secretion system protein ImpK